MLTLCFLAVLALTGITAGGIYVNIKHHRQSSIVSQAFVSYFCDQVEDGLTAFDQSLNNLAQITAAKQASMIVASMRGQVSAALKTTEQALEEEAYQNNPEGALQAAIAASLPKKIAKNELAKVGMTDFIMKMISGAGKGGKRGIPQNGTPAAGDQVKFNF